MINFLIGILLLFTCSMSQAKAVLDKDKTLQKLVVDAPWFKADEIPASERNDPKIYRISVRTFLKGILKDPQKWHANEINVNDEKIEFNYFVSNEDWYNIQLDFKGKKTLIGTQKFTIIDDEGCPTIKFPAQLLIEETSKAIEVRLIGYQVHYFKTNFCERGEIRDSKRILVGGISIDREALRNKLGKDLIIVEEED